MQYLFSQVPNTAHAKRYKVRSTDGKKEVAFDFSKSIIVMWGNPVDKELQDVMVAYIQRDGWAKGPVSLTEKNSEKNLWKHIASLQKSK